MRSMNMWNIKHFSKQIASIASIPIVRMNEVVFFAFLFHVMKYILYKLRHQFIQLLFLHKVSISAWNTYYFDIFEDLFFGWLVFKLPGKNIYLNVFFAQGFS